jgi:hypothetical protein
MYGGYFELYNIISFIEYITMYFLIGSDFTIHNVCCDKHDVYKMILDTLQNICAVSVCQTNDWTKIDKEGFYYYKKDNVIELRKYWIEEGYIASYMSYQLMDIFHISDFSSPEVNIFVEQLKSEIKARYRNDMNDLTKLNKRHESLAINSPGVLALRAHDRQIITGNKSVSFAEVKKNAVRGAGVNVKEKK